MTRYLEIGDVTNLSSNISSLMMLVILIFMQASNPNKEGLAYRV